MYILTGMTLLLLSITLQLSSLPEAVGAHRVSYRLAPPLATHGTAAIGRATASRSSSRHSQPITNPFSNILCPKTGHRVSAKQKSHTITLKQREFRPLADYQHYYTRMSLQGEFDCCSTNTPVKARFKHIGSKLIYQLKYLT